MRVRLGTMLVVVAVISVLRNAEMTRRLWATYRQQAALHSAERAKSERILRVLDAEIARDDRYSAPRGCGNGHRVEDAVRSLAATCATRAKHHARLSEEFLRRWESPGGAMRCSTHRPDASARPGDEPV
jgi:hypothetical protein